MSETDQNRPLLATDALYRAVLEQSSDQLLVMEPGPDGIPVIVEANQAALDAHGYSRDELIGQSITLLDPTVPPPFHDRGLDALTSGGTLHFEVRHRRKDGSWFDLEARTALVSIAGRRLILSVERDITERKRAEERLRHSHGLMNYIISHARSAIAVHDRELRYVYVSERYLKEYGVTERDIIGRHHYDVFPDLPQKWRDVHQRALRGEVSSAEEDSYPRADGSVEWTRWECRPWYEADGSIGGFIIYTEVITDRVRARQRLQESEAELRRSQAIALVGHWVLDVASGVAAWSDEMKRIFGLEPEGDARAQFERALERVHPEDRASLREAARATMAMEEAAPVEFRLLGPDGGIRHIRAVPGDRTADANGRLVRVTGVVQDVTELRRSEEQRRALETQLQQAMKMEAVGRLAGGIAHDFNNLLTGIIGNASLALMDLDEADPLATLLQEIGRAADSAASLTRQLLAFSRKQIIEPKVLDLNDLLSTMHKLLTRVIGEDVTLRTSPGPGLGSVRVDPGQFEQVLVNLAVNARDAMPDGGQLVIETANVDLDEDYCATHPQAKTGRFVMLAVSDTGHGMDDEVKRHLFEPFFTTKPQGRGTGLGLATIFGAVRQAGGSIEVYSEVGRGTSFKVYLPRADEAADTLPADRAMADMPGGEETILLVEDESVVRELAIRILTRLGYRVIEAPAGARALELAGGHDGPIHVLLTDVVMPGLNGRELAERLALTHPETKVLYASGYTDNVIVHHGVLEERLNFIGKPYTPQALAAKIRQVLDQR